MPTNQDQDAVVDTVNHYLKGISDASIAKTSLETAFYSSTNLHSLGQLGELQFQPRDSLVAMAASGEVPPHRSDILTVEVVNDMAFAKIHLDMPDRHFYDYLTLLKLKLGWKIVSKTYTTVMK